ncbi:hypothetical protein [Ensifer aridi]|uniref:hypothetical protein n=1 Tax=Ensifer aridi TaxID=1708715 RepID=UPI003590222B
MDGNEYVLGFSVAGLVKSHAATLGVNLAASLVTIVLGLIVGPICGSLIDIIKASSLVFFISISKLTTVAMFAVNATGNSRFLFAVALFGYCYLIARTAIAPLVHWLERRFSRGFLRESWQTSGALSEALPALYCRAIATIQAALLGVRYGLRSRHSSKRYFSTAMACDRGVYPLHLSAAAGFFVYFLLAAGDRCSRRRISARRTIDEAITMAPFKNIPEMWGGAGNTPVGVSSGVAVQTRNRGSTYSSKLSSGY